MFLVASSDGVFSASHTNVLKRREIVVLESCGMIDAMVIMLLSLLSFLLRKTDLAPRLVGFSFCIPAIFHLIEP
jgi:hypothetical protein